MPTKKPRPNLTDVAHHSGVSPATVSRVLNNTAPVSEDVRARVLNSLSALGYEPPLPRTLGRHAANTIALLIPDILNPYFTEVVRGVEDEVGADEFMPLLLDTVEDPQREQQLLRMLTNQPVSGIIVCASRLVSDDLLAVHRRHKIPMVTINRYLRHPNVACILVDFENATYRATRHLLALNHIRIGFLSGPSASEASQTRGRGIELALTEGGLHLRPELCVSSFPSVDGGFQAMSALLTLPPTERPTAVIAYNDVMALGALHAIRAHHMRVPEDISVIGFDDIAMAAHTNPPLTTIAPPKHRMGRLAMQTLRRMIQGQPPPEEGYTLMESPLIVRESTAPAPSSNVTILTNGRLTNGRS